MNDSQETRINQGHQDIVEAIQKLEERVSNIEKLMEQIKPYIEATAGLGVIGKVFFALGGIAVTWLAIKSTFNL
jgi:hypothetical protein